MDLLTDITIFLLAVAALIVVIVAGVFLGVSVGIL